MRLEDIDEGRCRAEYADAILEDLAWLGTAPDGPVVRQSQRLQLYRAALARLQAMGLVYRCFRTRSELLAAIGAAPQGDDLDPATRPGPLPPQAEAERLAAGAPFAWRLDAGAALDRVGGDPPGFLEEGAGPAGERGWLRPQRRALDDVILARKDLGVSYHLAVVVDDADQGVTHVIRGQDLFASTPVQRLLQALLGLPEPVYRHHRLILRPDGKRFAKRDTTETLQALRARGVTPDQLRRDLGLPAL